jgi:hypothetical protein
MDANISDRTMNVLMEMRPKHDIFFHWNKFKRAANDKYHFCIDKQVWLAKLYDSVKNDQKIVVPMNSFKEANTLENIIRKKFPDKKVKLYSSQTLSSEKNKHFADVHTYWSGIDILIYTPTVSAGISYELKHFDTLFGYFTDKSCDVETCRQMLGRIRNLSTNEHYICLDGRYNNLPTSTDRIKELLYSSRSNLYKKLENNDNLALNFEFGADGKIQYHESAYFVMWLENKRIENLSRNYFINRFIDQVADSGASVEEFTLELLNANRDEDSKITTRMLSIVKANYSGVKEEIKDVECEFIASSPNIDMNEFNDIRTKMSTQSDITSEDRGKYTKHRLISTYNWYGKTIDKSFVSDYEDYGVSSIFRNLRRIMSEPTLVESLTKIQMLEVDRNKILMTKQLTICDQSSIRDESACDSKDLHYKYVFQQHFLTIWLIKMLGFSSITDTKKITMDDIYTNIKNQEQEFVDKFDSISFEFKIKRDKPITLLGTMDKELYLKRSLTIINRVTRMMYGLEIKKLPKRDCATPTAKIGFNKHGRLFTIVPFGTVKAELKLLKKPYIISKLGIPVE